MRPHYDRRERHNHTGKKYAYYKCVDKKDGCKQETVQKDTIEEAVVQDTLKLLDDKLINQISQALHGIAQNEFKNGNIQRLETTYYKQEIKRKLNATAYARQSDRLNYEKLD